MTLQSTGGAQAAHNGRSTPYPLGFVVLHWALAAIIVAQAAMGLRAANFSTRGQVGALMSVHKPLGLLILLTLVVRILWRMTFRSRPTLQSLARWERITVSAVHVGFYVIIAALALSGWFGVSASPAAKPIHLFGLSLPLLPGVANLSAAQQHDLGASAASLHFLLAKLLIVLIVMHLTGVLRHQSDEPPGLARMMPGATSRLNDGRLLSVLVTMLAAAAVAFLI